MLRGKDGELSVAQRLVCGATAGCVAFVFAPAVRHTALR